MSIKRRDIALKAIAMQMLEEGKVLTGLLYINNESKDLKETLNVVDRPLNQLNEEDLCPGSEKLKEINEDLR